MTDFERQQSWAMVAFWKNSLTAFDCWDGELICSYEARTASRTLDVRKIRFSLKSFLIGCKCWIHAWHKIDTRQEDIKIKLALVHEFYSGSFSNRRWDDMMMLIWHPPPPSRHPVRHRNIQHSIPWLWLISGMLQISQNQKWHLNLHKIEFIFFTV